MGAILRSILAPEAWPAFVCITARLSGLMLVGPLWSMTAIPRTVRGAVVVVLAMMLLPGAPRTAMPDHLVLLPATLAADLAVGVAIGLAAAVVMHGVALAGEVISVQSGLSIGATLAPMAEIPAPGIGELQGFLALTVYVALGGHLTLVQGLGQSLQAIPPGAMANLADGGTAAAALVAGVFTTGIRVAAPVMGALLVSNVALALLNRAVPQLNTMMVSFPVTIALGLLMLGAALPLAAKVVAAGTSALPGQVDGLLRGFTPVPVR